MGQASFRPDSLHDQLHLDVAVLLMPMPSALLLQAFKWQSVVEWAVAPLGTL